MKVLSFVFVFWNFFGLIVTQNDVQPLDERPILAIGLVGVVGAIGAGLAIAQSANQRAEIQDSINSLNTDVATLSTSITSASTTLTEETSQATMNNANLNLICSAIATISGLAPPTSLATSGTTLETIKSALAITCT